MKDFLDFNDKCPICQEPLTLYMQWSSDLMSEVNKLFDSVKHNDHYQFSEHSKNTKQLGLFGQEVDKKGSLSMMLNKNTCEVKFNSLSTEKMAKEQDDIYFYFLCNPAGIEYTGSDYQINNYKGCYYRATPFIKFEKENNKLMVKYPATPILINRNESFALKSKINDLEKVYILDLNNEEDKTTLWHYSVTDEQLTDDMFEVNVFEKEMPLMKNRPDVDEDNREKLFQRLDGWILMS